MARVTQRYQQRQRWTMSQCRPGWSAGAGRSWSRPSKAQSCRCWPLAPALAEVHGQAEGRVRAGEDGRGEPGPAVWVGDRVELDDLALGDGEGDHGVGPPVHPQDGAGRTVDQGRVHLGGGAGALERLAGDGGCSTGHGGPARAARAEVGTDHHLGVEHGHQGVEVARAAGGEEGVPHGSLPGQITSGEGSRPP
jgi:hypothetical protein